MLSKHFHCVEGSDLSHTQKILLPEILKLAPASIHSRKPYVAPYRTGAGVSGGVRIYKIFRMI